MNKFRKKIVVPITLILVGCCVMVTFILHDSLTKVDANVAFNGISDIVESHGKDSPFNIVEVVPDKRMATIGYLIDGQEPDNWKMTLSGKTADDGSGSKIREDYIAELKEKLSPITTENPDNTKPLYYQPYQESYVDSGNDWTELQLAGMDRISAGTQGYKMVESENGEYKFNTDYQLSVNDEGIPTGKYRQNVNYYVYIPNDDSGESSENEVGAGKRGYYSIAFKVAAIPDEMTNTEYFKEEEEENSDEEISAESVESGPKAYKVRSAYAIVSAERMEYVAKYDPKAYIYRVDKADITSPYEFVAPASTYKDSTATLNFDDFTYYTLEFEYVPYDEIQDTATYYVVDDENIPVFNADKTGEYGATLNADYPYVKIEDNETDGYFNMVDNSQAYSYVGAGNGNYNMEADANGALDYPVNTNRIYYKGGFTNNNWFRNGVFNQEDNEKSKEMTFNVLTVTPGELQNIDIATIDLLYLSGTNSILSKDCKTTYSANDDITWDKVKEIVSRVHQSGIMMPVIVDNGIVWPGGGANYSSNIRKLAALLSCNNFESLNFSNDSNENFINWSNALSYYKVDSSAHLYGYTIGNEYLIPKNKGTNDVPFILMDDFAKPFIQNNDENEFLTAAKKQNFDEIAEYINSENKIRKTENDANTGTTYNYFDKKISKEIVISYIISYADKRDVSNPVEELNILDIEPGMKKTSIDNCKNALLGKLKNWLGSNCPTSENITITCVNSSEFIGRIEDLNNYDMINMGLCSDNLNKDTEGNTVYNDSKMNGLIYSNVGDIVVINPADTRDENGKGWTYQNGHAGLLDSDYLTTYDGGLGLVTTVPTVSDKNYTTSVNTYRGSGNDLTDEKIKDLQDYLKAGFPIVVSNGFYKDSDTSQVNDYYIDNSSKIYDFLKNESGNEHMLKVDGNGNLTDLYNKLTTEKPQIVLKEQKKVEGTDYVKLDSRQITLEFSINNKGGADAGAYFDIGFYLDSNADGKFSATREEISANNIKIYQNGSIITPQNDADGNLFYNLPSGKYEYKLVYDLPEQYVGIISWQLKVSQATNEYRYDVISGYFYRENETGEKQHIKVLQIDTSSDLWGESTFNMQKEAENYNSKFSELLRKVNDFELDITTYAGNSQDFINLCKNDELKNYDMLVIGFSDCYEIFNDNGQVDAIRKYIESGKAVLFTHDTTSFCNNKYNTERYDKWNDGKSFRNNIWGYDFNTIVRDLVGMDRYGILNNTALKKGETLSSGTTDYNNAITEAEDINTDIAYEPSSGKQTIVRQNQGFSNIDLNNYQWSDDSHGPYRLYSDINADSADTTTAVKVNSGQITTYPFKIKDEITVAKTHKQYYQLDLNEDSDSDGESDIVVWYTLSGHKNYDVSPKDVRNNYYIYTKGNVTYSGVGHSNVTLNEDELKLYINTMIAAYSVVEHAPDLYLKESYDINSSDINTLYASIDTAIEQENKNNPAVDGELATEDVYFTVKDTNMIRNQLDKDTVVHVNFYTEGTATDYDKTITENNTTIYLKEQKNWQIYSLNDDGSENELYGISAGGNNRTYFANNRTYKVKVPLSTLPSGKNSIKIYAVASSDITVIQNNEKVVKTTPETYDTFQIQRVGLADLD